MKNWVMIKGLMRLFRLRSLLLASALFLPPTLTIADNTKGYPKAKTLEPTSKMEVSKLYGIELNGIKVPSSIFKIAKSFTLSLWITTAL